MVDGGCGATKGPSAQPEVDNNRSCAFPRPAAQGPRSRQSARTLDRGIDTGTERLAFSKGNGSKPANGLLFEAVLGGALQLSAAILCVASPNMWVLASSRPSYDPASSLQERYKRSLSGEDEERGPVFEWLAQPEEMVGRNPHHVLNSPRHDSVLSYPFFHLYSWHIVKLAEWSHVGICRKLYLSSCRETEPSLSLAAVTRLWPSRSHGMGSRRELISTCGRRMPPRRRGCGH